MQRTGEKGTFTDKIAEAVSSLLRGSRKANHRFETPSGTVRHSLRLSAPAAKRAALVATGLGMTVFSFALASVPLPLGIYPLGLALVIVSGKMSFFSFIGASAACLTYRSLALPYFALNFLIFITRKAFTSSEFDETRTVKILEGAAAGVFLGLSSYVFGGFLLYDLFSAAALVCTLTLSIFLFCGFFERVFEKKEIGESYFEMSVCVLIAAFLFSLRGISVFTFSVSAIAAGAVTLSASKAGGALYGGAAGLLCGIAAGGDVSYAAIFGLGGMLAGMTFQKSAFLSLTLFLFCSSGMSAYTSGISSLRNEIPDMIASMLLFTLFMNRIPEGILTGHQNLPSQSLAERNNMQKNLDGLSCAFTSLSQVFFKLSDKMRYPGASEVKGMIRRSFERTCSSCAMQSLCYGRSRVDGEEMKKTLFDALVSGGVKYEDFPPEFAERCVKLDEIMTNLNGRYRELAGEYFKNNKTEILASEYSAMARIIKYTSQKSKNDTTPDKRLVKNVTDALSGIGVKFTEVRAYGKRSKTIEVYGVTIDRIPCTAKELSEYMSGQCKVKLSEPEFVFSDNCFIMKLYSRKKVALEYAQAARAKGQGDVNGDSICFFENDEGYFYALISDGMGSGRQAALTSRLTSVFIEKLLTTGAHKTVTLEMLNNLLLAKNDESFATVDLLEVDLINAEASFIKAGAAPAYIIRATKLYKIASATPPAGIIQCFSAENTRFSLEAGDIILMLSDGIIQSFDDTPWLSEIIKFNPHEDVALLASKVLEKAKQINLRDDDMSVVAARVVEA